MFENKLETKLFKDVFIIMLIDELVTTGMNFLNGVLINGFLGNVAIAAQGIVSPCFGLFAAFSGILAVGTQLECLNSITQGKIDEAEKFFNTSFWTALFVSVLTTVLLFVFSDSAALALGAKQNPDDLLLPASLYIKGISLGIPPIVLIPILTPIVHAEGKNTNLKIAIFSNLVIDVLLAVISGILKWGMLGMGLSITIASWVTFIIIFVPFLKRTLLKTDIRLFRIKELKTIFFDGSPRLVSRFGKFLKPVIINSFIIYVGGTVAMSAMSIGNNILSLFGCVCFGLGSTVIMLTILYVSEHNGNELLRLIKHALRYMLYLVIPLSILLFFLAPVLALLYAKDSEELKALTADFIRFIAIDLVALALSEILTNYWQGIKRTKYVNIILILQKLIYPVCLLFLLGHFFGIKGIWISFPAADLLSVLTFKLFGGKFFPKATDCAYENSIQKEYLIKNAEQVSEAIPDIIDFCEKNGMDRKSALFLSISFEETAMNIVQHGFKMDKKSNSIYVYLMKYEDKMTMRIQDDCEKFNVIEKYMYFQKVQQDPQKCIGIKMIMKLSNKVQYVNTFETNNVIITM